MKGNRIIDVLEIRELARARRSVCTGIIHHLPAACVLNMSLITVLRMIDRGMWRYVREVTPKRLWWTLLLGSGCTDSNSCADCMSGRDQPDGKEELK